MVAISMFCLLILNTNAFDVFIFPQKGAYRALYFYDADEEDEVSLNEGDDIITNAIVGHIQRTGDVVVLPMFMLERVMPG